MRPRHPMESWTHPPRISHLPHQPRVISPVAVSPLPEPHRGSAGLLAPALTARFVRDFLSASPCMIRNVLQLTDSRACHPALVQEMTESICVKFCFSILKQIRALPYAITVSYVICIVRSPETVELSPIILYGTVYEPRLLFPLKCVISLAC
jgi:hypothetical protein